MVKLAIISGGFITIWGIAGVIVRFFPPYDGEILIAGALILASGIVSNVMLVKQR